eukprot:CAMPEP_0172194724 /NCGR_PEP_ID=MMETSP1050-20130122/25764_1 /TAXON_ID=233186 /ORGANISM="Cryptomonas curvata, Strain CCAP979/52" /LENGTH=140 /DNA_ID=CAMNT_0012870613 /DNA_START=61 /DNA_END=480 /DNA_ORIENTATION=+
MEDGSSSSSEGGDKYVLGNPYKNPAESSDSESGEDDRIKAYAGVFKGPQHASKGSVEKGSQDRWNVFAKVVQDSIEDGGSLSDNGSLPDVGSDQERTQDITADFATSDESDADAQPPAPSRLLSTPHAGRLNGSWADWLQ